MNVVPTLSLLTLTPLLGSFVVMGINPRRPCLAQSLALVFSGLGLGWAVLALGMFDPSQAGVQLQERHAWTSVLGVDYFLGVDGLGLTMVVLTALLVPMAQWVAWPMRERAPLFQGLILQLQAGLFGTFTALNFFHWFLFWELSLVPAFFLIKLWGGPIRSQAATQFFVYTMAGSVTLLLAFLGLFLATGTMDFLALAEQAADGRLREAVGERLAWGGMSVDAMLSLLFLGTLLAFAVKVPLMPFHTWLPMTYAEAPTPVTMLLTGAMSKMGLYGVLRLLLPIFPDSLQAWRVPLLVLAVVTVVGGAAVAMVQRDLKRLLAYSSVNHLGYCLLAVFAVAGSMGGEVGASHRAAALNGATLQMFNHGLTAATLFAFVAFFERRSLSSKGLGQVGGLRRVAPIWAGLMGVAVFSSLGLPGLNGFVGELLIFKGVFGLAPVAALVSTSGLLMTAIFLLSWLQQVFFGPLRTCEGGFRDLSRGELWTVVPAVGLMLWLGLWPQSVVGLFNQTIVGWVERWPW
jgi:NADH-quinone oxidoreductase subunit M